MQINFIFRLPSSIYALSKMKDFFLFFVNTLKHLFPSGHIDSVVIAFDLEIDLKKKKEFEFLDYRFN